MCEHEYTFFPHKNFKQKFNMINRNDNYKKKKKPLYGTRRISENENKVGDSHG